MQWSDLPEPWQACWQEGWKGWCSGSLFIGSVITDGSGRVVARGRNHIYDVDAPAYQVSANQLAHAELNALLDLRSKPADVHSYHIYTLVEPCPLCLGAIYMSGVRAIHYASRDPYAGSANLLGTTPYLSRKPVRAYPPDLPELEIAVAGLGLANEFLNSAARGIALSSDTAFIAAYQAVLPRAFELGERLAREQYPARWRLAALDASAVFAAVIDLL